MESLAWGLIETVLTGAVSLVVAVGAWAFAYLKGQIEAGQKKQDDLHNSLHELEKKLIAEYASKADLKEVVRESLAPLKDSFTELKSDVKAMIRAIDDARRYGPPE